MSLNINKRDVLVVNRGWIALGVITIKKAFEQLLSISKYDDIVSKAFDIEYEYLGDEKWNFDNCISIRDLPFENWKLLPVRPFDNAIHTAKQAIRVPNVIMAVNCEKSHLREIKLSTRAILERDNYICQYTGKQLPRHKLNIDHVIPKDRGGTDSWTNMVASSIEINSKKGNKLNSEAGLKLIREPKKPLPLPASSLIREIRNRDWSIFLKK
jgi:5-methylcytosine-specific restriction endonuclease McrA